MERYNNTTAFDTIITNSFGNNRNDYSPYVKLIKLADIRGQLRGRSGRIPLVNKLLNTLCHKALIINIKDLKSGGVELNNWEIGYISKNTTYYYLFDDRSKIKTYYLKVDELQNLTWQLGGTDANYLAIFYDKTALSSNNTLAVINCYIDETKAAGPFGLSDILFPDAAGGPDGSHSGTKLP